MNTIKTLKQAINLSIDDTAELGEHDADLKITVEGKTWHCYTVHINNREFLCYCNEGCATFLVDSYGDRHACELFDWETEQ